jgi:hypothetical protein
MQKLQLYVQGERLDLFRDESVSITQSIKNIKELDKIYTDFTQTFSVPASKSNNQIFKHYYNYDIVNGFDARSKVAGSIELNYTPFKNGFIRLDGVDLQRNLPYAYRITFFGATVNLKDLIGEDQLSYLNDLSQYNLDYNYTTIKAKLSDPITSGTQIIAPLISHTSRLFYQSAGHSEDDIHNLYYQTGAGHNHGVAWSDLKYALRIDAIIRAIEVQYGITFSDDFFDSSNLEYYNLFMWLHRKKGDVEPARQIPTFTNQVNDFTYTSGGTQETGMSNGNTLLIYTQNIQYSPYRLAKNNLRFATASATPYTVQIIKNGGLFFQSEEITGNKTFTQTDIGWMYPGSYTVSVSSLVVPLVFSVVEWEIEGYNSGGSTWSDIYQSSTFSVTTNFEFLITEQVPEMKVIDFLSALFNMFNLVVYAAADGTIIVKTLDDYYSSSGLWNTTESLWNLENRKWNEIGATDVNYFTLDKYVVTDQSQVNVALPYAQVDFQYEGLGTFLAKQYNQLNNKGWGTELYSLDAETYDAPNEIYKITLPFEHVLYERLVDVSTSLNTLIQYGYFVDDNQQPYFGKPLLFYPIRQVGNTSTNNNISIRDGGSTHERLTEFIIPSNSLALSSVTSGSNINFYNEINEYQLDSSFTGTLFNLYYNTYIAEIFNNKRRFINVKAFLPLNIIYNLKLNDVIFIYGQGYRINSITTNLTTGESDMELLNLL